MQLGELKQVVAFAGLTFLISHSTSCLTQHCLKGFGSGNRNPTVIALHGLARLLEVDFAALLKPISEVKFSDDQFRFRRLNPRVTGAMRTSIGCSMENLTHKFEHALSCHTNILDIGL